MPAEVEVGVSEGEAHRGFRQLGRTGHTAIAVCERGRRVEGSGRLAAKQGFDLDSLLCEPATGGFGLRNPQIGETHIAPMVGDLAVP